MTTREFDMQDGELAEYSATQRQRRIGANMMWLEPVTNPTLDECEFCYKSPAAERICSENVGPDGEDSYAAVAICRVCLLKNQTYRKLLHARNAQRGGVPMSDTELDGVSTANRGRRND